MKKAKQTLADWLAWQETLHPRAVDLGLERVRAVASRLDVLAFDCPVITVGGTNGKGSCVALLDAVLSAAGYRAGVFTSPHLIRYNERIRVAGRTAADEELVAAFERIDAARGEISLTFFEFNALAALVLFKTARLDAVVLEVGLGGRLDAVNVVDADVALLTTVGLDHCDWLGNTEEDIGREKAGIFRAGRPAVLGSASMPGSVVEAARRIGARVLLPGVDYEYAVQADGWRWQGGEMRFEELPRPALAGRQQLGNAAAVLQVLEALRARLPVTREAVARGLQAVSLPGRFDRRVATGGAGPEWIFDVAHNPQAAAVLAENLAAWPCAGKTLAVLGVLRDKDAAGIVAPLLQRVSVWIAASLHETRGESAAELVARCGGGAGAPANSMWLQAETVDLACERAAQMAGAEDRIVVFGSFHTVGPALRWFEAGRLSA